MLTTALIIAGACFLAYIVLSVISSLVEFLACAFGVLAIVVVVYVGWNLLGKALPQPPTTHTHHAHHTTL